MDPRYHRCPPQVLFFLSPIVILFSFANYNLFVVVPHQCHKNVSKLTGSKSVQYIGASYEINFKE